jgi:AcrR family transcriptional regulator
MPRLWTDSIEEHRREVRDAIIDTTAGLVAEGGLLAVTMSRIADQTGIGRATLYRYFPDVEAILDAWHERQVALHLKQLSSIQGQPGRARDRLAHVLEAYARIRHEARHQHEPALAAVLHRDDLVAGAERSLLRIIRDLLTEAAESGHVRHDVGAEELAIFCVHALAAAGALPSRAAVERLVRITLDALRPSD